MPAWTTPDPVAMHARAQPDRLACVDLASGRNWTYAALDDAIQRAAAVLESHGVEQGQRIAALARNSADLVILQQAAMRLGAIFVPVNWRLAAVERQVILADCGPSLLVHDADLDIAAPSGCAAVAIARFAAAVEAATRAARHPLPEADRPSIILYTSGTSGRPKGVIVTEANAFATAVNFGVVGRVGHDSIVLCDAPMFHVIGLITNLRPVFLKGGTVLISSGFDAGVTNRRLADPDVGVTHYFCVPQMAKMLREHASFAPARWTSLKALFTGGAPNPAAWFIGAQ
ncbi:hypothetical protein EN792_062815 [Mesorhizobium sp. M00.F.Ca.ET.149.01.1.1]|nr:hypothetical protein EN792_062815 [Mesorhizobium sp. M00.F.Ca.ET.149.01.1.1]